MLFVPVQLKLMPAPPPIVVNKTLSLTTLPRPLMIRAPLASDTSSELIVLAFPTHIPTLKLTTVLPLTVELEGKAIPTPADTPAGCRR